VVAAIQDTLGIRDDDVFKSTTGLAGGGGLTGIGFCRGYVGGVMVPISLCGRERSNFPDPERIRFKSFDLAKKLTDDFLREFGTVIRRDIHIKKFGHPYYLKDSEDFNRFENAGGHVDKCADVVGRAAQIAVKIILEGGFLSPPSK
jgi:hypothetical protein